MIKKKALGYFVVLIIPIWMLCHSIPAFAAETNLLLTHENTTEDLENISYDWEKEESERNPDSKLDGEFEETEDSLISVKDSAETVFEDEQEETLFNKDKVGNEFIYTEDLDIDSEEVSSADVVHNEDELRVWLEEHDSGGGTVTLGNVVTITEYIYIGGHSESSITIDTGNVGLVLDGAVIDGRERLSIVGEGVDVPVVDVLSAGKGNFWEHSWNNVLIMLNVTATGRDDLGGIAMRILGLDSKSFNDESTNEQGVIRSYGTGAVGLWLDIPMDVCCYQVEVFGENSVAVYAPKGANLYYCKLMAEGENASTVKGINLLLDTCVASPEPEGVKNVKRQILEDSLNQLYLPVKQNERIPYWIYNFNTIAFFLSGSDEFGEAIRHFSVYWDYDAYDSIDTSIAGKIVISGKVNPVFYGLGVFDNISIELIVEVRDPALPCINRVIIMENDEGRYARLEYWDAFNPEDENAVLWRSDDEGETWQDITHFSEIRWCGGCLEFPTDNLEHPVLLQLEMVGTGESNIVVLQEKDGVTYGGKGGDRTGTDRGGSNASGGNGNQSQSENENETSPSNEESFEQSQGAGNKESNNITESHNKDDNDNDNKENAANRWANGTGRSENEFSIQYEDVNIYETNLPNKEGSNEFPVLADDEVSISLLQEDEIQTNVVKALRDEGLCEETLSSEQYSLSETLPQDESDYGSQYFTQEGTLPLEEAEQTMTTLPIQSQSSQLPGMPDASTRFRSEQSVPSDTWGKEMIFVFLGMSFIIAVVLTIVKLFVKGR